MRTTVRIEDDLYRRVKARAGHEGRTVAAVLEDAVRIGMRPPAEPSGRPYRVRSHGEGGLLPGADLSSNASINEILDRRTPIERLR